MRTIATTLVMLAAAASTSHRSLVGMLYVVVFQDVFSFLISCAVGLVIVLGFGVAAVLFLVGMVSHRRRLWIAGLIVGLVTFILAILALVAVFVVYSYWVSLGAAEPGGNL